MRLKNFFSSELGKGSLILLITMGIYNLLNFVFHFVLGRFLGPEDYGILAVLMSIIYLYAIPSEAIQNIISKYTSRFNLRKEKGKIKYMMNKSLKKGFKYSLILFLTFIIISYLLSIYLKINIFLILLTNVTLFFSFLIPIIRGILQGRKKFSLLGTSMILESSLKLIFAISLVVFGLKVFGAMIGVLLGLSATFIFSMYFNREIAESKEEKTSFEGIYSSSIPYFIAMLIVFLIFSTDIILAKRFFSPELSGQYAVLSILGKVIFFGTIAIGKTMFPLTSEKTENKKDASDLFKKSFLMALTLCLVVSIIYYQFPILVVKVLYGSQYLLVAPLLIYSALALTFLSLTNLNLLYGLSTNRLRNSKYLFLFLILEITLLYLYHSNLREYILAFMFSNIIMFIGSFLFIKKS